MAAAPTGRERAFSSSEGWWLSWEGFSDEEGRDVVEALGEVLVAEDAEVRKRAGSKTSGGESVGDGDQMAGLW